MPLLATCPLAVRPRQAVRSYRRSPRRASLSQKKRHPKVPVQTNLCHRACSPESLRLVLFLVTSHTQRLEILDRIVVGVVIPVVNQDRCHDLALGCASLAEWMSPEVPDPSPSPRAVVTALLCRAPPIILPLPVQTLMLLAVARLAGHQSRAAGAPAGSQRFGRHNTPPRHQRPPLSRRPQDAILVIVTLSSLARPL